ncbi:serine hydrolase [Lysobacter korlensis]|uniref:Serine hydrolase n=1 Tax=Lysobacter korlensis TaxID=553636 RepID=A0ABV6RRJ5_9GAMM
MKNLLPVALAAAFLCACPSIGAHASAGSTATESRPAVEATGHASVVGRYTLDGGPELQVSEHEGQLLGRLGGNDPTVLEPLSARTFRPAAQPDARITFEPPSGRAERVVVVMPGARMQGVRIDPPADADPVSLDDELARLDAALFHAAFVACDIVRIRGMLAEDIEFVHDRSGLRQRGDVIKDFERLTADCPAGRGIRRELVEGSLRAFPIAHVGALQTGEHRFIEAGAQTYTAARFSTLWRKESNGAWRVARVLSYDHRPVPVGSATPATAPAATPPAASAVARLAETVLAAAYDPDAPGAAVLVMRGDEVLFRGARGLADVDANVPLSPDARFRIGSVTKQIAAAGLLKLVEAGRVALEDPLSKYLPRYPGAARITVEQLLNHTSGIGNYTEMPGIMEGPIQRDLTTEQLVDHFKGQAPDFAPGGGWKYNNSGYVLVGAVIETVSGQPWHRYLKQELFTPLGMNDTGYGADPDVTARQVKGYGTDGHGAVPAKPLSMTQPHAGGALVSTVDDLARWSRALHGGRVLRPDLYMRMITPVGQATESGYGYGISISREQGSPAFEHGGWIFGFTSHLIYVPEPGLSVVVLHNSDSPSRGREPGSIARQLTAAALGEPLADSGTTASRAVQRAKTL